MNPFEILEVPQDFTLEQLKENFKRLAMKVHPDRGGNEALFIVVKTAFKQLLKEHHNRVNDKQFHELKRDFRREGAPPTPPVAGSEDTFNIRRFNKVFDKNKMDDVHDKGYQDWMQRHAVADGDVKKMRGVTEENFNSMFEKTVPQRKDVIIYKEPQPLEMSQKIAFTEIGCEGVDDFSAENTTQRNLQFMDYRVAHTTSRIVDPASVQYQEYRNVQELEAARSKMNHAMTEKEHKEYETKKRLEAAKERARLELLKRRDREIEEHYSRVNMLMLGGR